MKRKHLPNLLCWLFASLGLFWQVYQVSEIFFGFQTRVDIEMDAPINLTMPAITVCLPLDPHPKTLNHLFHTRNLTFAQMKEEVTYLPINILSTLETIDVKVFCRTKYPRVIDGAPDGQPCDLFGETIHSMQYNQAFKEITHCTTYLHQKEDRPLTVISNEAKDFYQLEIYSAKPNSFYVYLHNPIEILNLPESDFLTIFTNQSSDVVIVTSRIVVSLPSYIFFTNCLDYTDVMFRRQGCIFECRNRIALATCGSWSSEVPAPVNSKLPFRSRQHTCPSPSDYKCESFEICPVACKSSWYSSNLVWNHFKETRSNLTRFAARRPYGLEFVYNVTPYLATVEYSCYVASCLGIWFGISYSDIMLRMFNLNEKSVESRKSHKPYKNDKQRSDWSKPQAYPKGYKRSPNKILHRKVSRVWHIDVLR
uniref:Sodium channel protein Nach n=1 Tax=Tetranychus urticae TaxID=32264 RepID=T1K887_TETUR